MFDFNKLVFRKSPYKYILYNVLCILLSVMMFFFVRDERGEEISVFLMVALPQIITIFRYFITRTVYRNEILESVNDRIHIFVESKKAKWRVFLYKVFQVFIFNCIQLACSFFVLIFMLSSKNEFTMLGISIGIGLIVTFIIYLFDFAYVNGMDKNFIEEWFVILVGIMPIIIFYKFKSYLLVIYIGILVFSVIININRIRRNL